MLVLDRRQMAMGKGKEKGFNSRKRAGESDISIKGVTEGWSRDCWKMKLSSWRCLKERKGERGRCGEGFGFDPIRAQAAVEQARKRIEGEEEIGQVGRATFRLQGAERRLRQA